MFRTVMFSDKPANARTQHADAAHNQVDFHPRLRRLVKLFDNLFIGQPVDFRDDVSRFPLPTMCESRGR